MRTLPVATLTVAMLAVACAPPAGAGVTPTASRPRATPQPVVTQTPPRPVPTTDPWAVEVLMGDHFFDPQVVTVKTGAIVTWRTTSGVHDVTARDGSFRSGPLIGTAFSHSFDRAGRYPYFCTIHPGEMQAEIVVESAN